MRNIGKQLHSTCVGCIQWRGQGWSGYKMSHVSCRNTTQHNTCVISYPLHPWPPHCVQPTQVECSCLPMFLSYQPEDGQWKGPKHVFFLYVINYTYLYHHIVVLDRYTNSNLVCWNLYAVGNIYRKQAGVSGLVELSINPTSPITAHLPVSQTKLMAVIYKTFLKVGNSIKYQMRTWSWWYFVAYILKRRIEENQVRLISFAQTFRIRCAWRVFRHNFGSASQLRRRKFLCMWVRVKWKL